MVFQYIFFSKNLFILIKIDIFLSKIIHFLRLCLLNVEKIFILNILSQILTIYRLKYVFTTFCIKKEIKLVRAI